MPLRCLNEGKEIYAFDFMNDADWHTLKKLNSESKCLRMACCGSLVILRTSKLGTKHFAHSRRGPCTSAPESEEHLLAKLFVVEGVQNASWTALAEQSGIGPDGESWRADVLATKASAKVAFEIQWSRQEDEETLRRQERYARAGVRGLWLLRQHDFPVSKEVPAFRLVFDDKSISFQVRLPSYHYDSRWISSRNKDNSLYWEQSLDLKKFVEGALVGKLQYAPVLGKRMPLAVYAADSNCWRCHKKTRVVMKLVFEASRILPGHSDIPLTIQNFANDIPGGEIFLMNLLPPNELKIYGIGPIKPRFSKSMGEAYLSNGCVHCDALQGRFFEHDLAFESKKVFEVETSFFDEWGHTLKDVSSYIYRWWFDESSMSSSQN